MEFFESFVSNTSAGSGNQKLLLHENGDLIRTGRIFYKINKSGTFSYSFLFSNIIDSTFSDGRESHCNYVCDSWKIHALKVAVCQKCFPDKMAEVSGFVPLSFCGDFQKTVAPGEFFSTDPVTLTVPFGGYLCVEISFSGKTIPCHEESIIPAFLLCDGRWEPSREMPFLSMLGCQRKVKLKIGFLGDSITQGIGTAVNSYEHWNYIIAQMLGNDYAYWNLGLGFGRAQDAASDGAWLFKAKQNDVVVLCFGVNDILQGRTEAQIKSDLCGTVQKLNESGVKVFIQSVPPFDYDEQKRTIFENVNAFIKEELSKKCIGYFDNVPALRESRERPYMAKYGGHPNAEGSTQWANALLPVLKDALCKI